MRPRSPLEHQQGCKHAAAESPGTLQAALSNNIQCAWSTPARVHACAFNIIKLQACNPGVPYAVIEFHKDSVDSDRSPPSNYKGSANDFFLLRNPHTRTFSVTSSATPPIGSESASLPARDAHTRLSQSLRAQVASQARQAVFRTCLLQTGPKPT